MIFFHQLINTPAMIKMLVRQYNIYRDKTFLTHKPNQIPIIFCSGIYYYTISLLFVK